MVSKPEVLGVRISVDPEATHYMFQVCVGCACSPSYNGLHAEPIYTEQHPEEMNTPCDHCNIPLVQT